MSRYAWRALLILVFLSLALVGILWRLVDLNFIDRDFLLKQSQARILRVVEMPAHRGMITDRLGAVLALSSPVYSVWVNPQKYHATFEQQKQLAQILQVSETYLQKRIQDASGREFVYLKRQNPPSVTQAVQVLNIPGVHFQMEYQRFYPESEVTAHVVGLTNIDDQGQEGLELAYNDWLRGTPGKKEVIKDRLGHVIADIALLKKPVEGHDLALSIDYHIQYAAYHALKTQIEKLHAKSGSIVVLNIQTGEILAMVNQPSYNPNNRPTVHDGRYRNRALTDSFEPGSTMKPFTIALALQSKQYTANTLVNTNAGRMMVGGYVIKDDGLNYGIINLKQILQKSSNIGAAKILLSLSPESFWNLLRGMGFGMRTRSGFPGESSGRLVSHTVWYPSDVATLAYGYGIAVTALQLAKAYATLGNDGISHSVSLLKVDQPPLGRAVLDPSVAHQVVRLLESVVEKGGTGTRAAVPGYRVAGKTGTAYIANANGYDKHKYVASFVGLAPVSHPQLVVAVVIRDPQQYHFGGEVAAPVFAKVMGQALRILNVAPDGLKMHNRV